MSEGNGAQPAEAQAEKRTVSAPQDWDKAVSVAYLRILEFPKKTVARLVEVDQATIWVWEQSAWWPDAEREAMSRWLRGVRAKAMKSLKRNLLADGNLALKVLERLMPEMGPPVQRHHVTGLFGAIQQMTPEELKQLEAMDDDQLEQEIDRLVHAGSE